MLYGNESDMKVDAGQVMGFYQQVNHPLKKNITNLLMKV